MKLNPLLAPLPQRATARPEAKDLTPEDARLRQASEDFESLLTQQMLKTMRDSGFKSDLLPVSSGEKIFRSMLDEQYAKNMAQSSGSGGLAEALMHQLQPAPKKE